MPKVMPKNPRLPVAELVISKDCTRYAWKCEKHGIMIFSDSKAEAPGRWLNAYRREYFSD